MVKFNQIIRRIILWNTWFSALVFTMYDRKKFFVNIECEPMNCVYKRFPRRDGCERVENL
jgi:hypothetical protein